MKEIQLTSVGAVTNRDWSTSTYRALLKQKFLLKPKLLSRIEQDTSHKLYMRHGSLAGKLILVSISMLCLATCCAELYNIGTWLGKNRKRIGHGTEVLA